MSMWESVDRVEMSGRGDCPECSEDRFGRSGPLAWILDGASTVSSEPVPGETDAIWMVEHLTGELKTLCYEPLSLKDLVACALRNTAAAAVEKWPAGAPEVPPSAALGVVRHAEDHVEFLVLADVSVILRTEAGAQWFIDRRVDEHNKEAFDFMKAALRDDEITFDEVSRGIRQRLAKPRRSKMNRLDGYWVASIDGAPAEHAITGTLDRVDELILASDGFMRALDLFGLVKRPDDLFTCDLAELAQRVRECERADPHTRNYPRWSVSDDICAHRIRWVD